MLVAFLISIFQISTLRISDCHLGESSTSLWVTLAPFTSLYRLYVKSSSLALSKESPLTLPLVEKIHVSYLRSNSYNGLITSLPGLKVIGNPCYLSKCDADIAQISLALRNSGGSLTHIYLDGQHAFQQLVSNESMKKLCDVIRDQTARLQEIKLWNMGIKAEVLVGLVEICRTVKTMRDIK